ncbi:hypothetical protein EXIGLDRAFT_288731 [Exidia glandulosa HHB12029]|uniref:Uncharacterized protein n=1 Tax=Exidia glandulosa HHB12029 TaxID=1314781 RepID=A0A165ZNS2_EXIGL|nr:hypothetical protein EXIGLDRAFT_288731 [Exidia glandulosa HHB12029]
MTDSDRRRSTFTCYFNYKYITSHTRRTIRSDTSCVRGSDPFRLPHSRDSRVVRAVPPSNPQTDPHPRPPHPPHPLHFSHSRSS